MGGIYELRDNHSWFSAEHEALKEQKEEAACKQQILRSEPEAP